MRRLLDLPLRAARRLASLLLRPLADDLASQRQTLASLQAQSAELLELNRELGLHVESLTREVVRLQLQLEALEGGGAP